MGNQQRSIIELREALERDISKYSINIARNIAQQIATDLTDEAASAIKDFYDHYDPEDPSVHNGRIYYYRHWNFEKSFKRYYKNRIPNFTGGVELRVNELPNVYTGRRSSPADVFKRVYFGRHGIASYIGYVPTMTPSPYQRLRDKHRDIMANEDKYRQRAIRIAQKDSYEYLDF